MAKFAHCFCGNSASGPGILVSFIKDICRERRQNELYCFSATLSPTVTINAGKGKAKCRLKQTRGRQSRFLQVLCLHSFLDMSQYLLCWLCSVWLFNGQLLHMYMVTRLVVWVFMLYIVCWKRSPCRSDFKPGSRTVHCNFVSRKRVF